MLDLDDEEFSQPVGRKTQIFFGVVFAGVAFLFWWLLILLVDAASGFFQFLLLVVPVGVVAWWFSLMSYRLCSGAAPGQRYLYGPRVVKVICLLLGGFSLWFTAFLLWEHEQMAAIVSFSMVTFCWRGWRWASSQGK